MLLLLCEICGRPPSKLDTTEADEAFLLHALNERARRQNEAIKNG